MQLLLSKLNSIERKVKNIPAVADSDIRAWVRAGLTYDKLTDEQRTRYNRYWGLTLQIFIISLAHHLISGWKSNHRRRKTRKKSRQEFGKQRTKLK